VRCPPGSKTVRLAGCARLVPASRLNGATEAQLMAIFGWSDPDMAALYTKKARQKRIAGDAMRLLVRKEREEQ